MIDIKLHAISDKLLSVQQSVRVFSHHMLMMMMMMHWNENACVSEHANITVMHHAVLKIRIINHCQKAFRYFSLPRSFIDMPAASKKRKVVATVEDAAAVGEVIEESTVTKDSTGPLRKITIEACKSWYKNYLLWLAKRAC